MNLEYSTDKQSWIVLEGNSIEIPANSKVYLRGNNDSTAVGMIDSNMGINAFTCSGQYNVGGNIMSLLYSDECMVKDTLTNASTFMGLFIQSTTLVNAKDLQLPATTLAEGCYFGMFLGCSSLTTAPELPATTLAKGCYFGMFAECTSLTIAPELPATTLAEGCYNYMFSACTSLTEIYAPNISTWDWAACDGWVENVADEGTMHFNTRALFDSIGGNGNTGRSSIPGEWTAHIIETGEYIKTEWPS